MYITTNHRGGIGNVMFKLAAVIGLAKKHNVDYIFPNQFLRPGIDPDMTRYSNNILRNINFIDRLTSPFKVWSEPQFPYIEIPYSPGENLLLDGYFQDEKYFIESKDLIINLFGCPEEFSQSVKHQIPDISNYISLHVRRGDYLKFPSRHPVLPISYYQKSVKKLGIEKTYIIFSDDIEWCKSNFDFIPNKIFITGTQDWMDLYMMSLCGSNIIANSTFSWWGAYLNQNPNKQVIGPSLWFGPSLTERDTSNLYPKNWIKI